MPTVGIATGVCDEPFVWAGETIGLRRRPNPFREVRVHSLDTL